MSNMPGRDNNAEHYDLIVIGAGSAGLSVAAGAAQLGLNTALIEKGEMGGDCLNTGCVPSKAMLHAARVAQTFRDAGPFGVAPQTPQIDFAGVKDHVRAVIGAIAPNDSQERFEGLGVAVVREQARFLDPHHVQAGPRRLRARYFVVATGSRPAIPPVPGLDPERIYTNENIFDLRETPEHLVIIGGGPIGIEMAQAHARLGARVTVLDMKSVLTGDDSELAGLLGRRLTDEGIEILEHAAIQEVSHGSDSSVRLTIRIDGEERSMEGSHLLVAAGRSPNTDTLDLDPAGVETTRAGIRTNRRLRSTQKHIYAAGDVAGGPQFTHIAGYHAGILIQNIAFKIPAKTDYSSLPWVTYTDPELANVGLTEEAAQEKYGAAKIRTVSWGFDENDRAQAERRTEGKIKVTALKNGHILGAAILGPHAGEMTGIWSLAITRKMRMKDITGIIAPYPTLGEVNKRVAGTWFTPRLFSDRSRKLVQWIQKLPF